MKFPKIYTTSNSIAITDLYH